MIEERPDPADFVVEEHVRRGLAREDAVRHSLGPVLRHLLGHDDRALFNDEVIARLRGMLYDLARHLCGHAKADGEPLGDDDPDIRRLSAALAELPGLLHHLHAIVLEWQAAQGLHERLGIDPVVAPLLQALIGSSDAETAATAMKLLAAQARFARYQQQMRMPLGELPGDLLPGVLELCEPGPEQAAIRQSYDESASRLGLIARLVTGMGGGAVAALALGHAGVAIFATALALATGQSRENCVLALQDGQPVRLALLLQATGVKPATAQASLLAVHSSPLVIPAVAPADGADLIARLSPDRAMALLAAVNGSGDWTDHGG